MSILEESERLQNLRNAGNAGVKRVPAVGTCFKQQSCQAFTGVVTDRRERLAVEHLTAVERSTPTHGHNRAASLGHIVEIKHGRSPERIKMRCVDSHRTHESQCPFAADHHVGDDVDRIVESDERTDVQACDILYGVLICNTATQLLVGLDLVADGSNLVDDLPVALGEGDA